MAGSSLLVYSYQQPAASIKSQHFMYYIGEGRFGRTAVVVVLLILWSVILRFFSFFPAVISHDESTYLVIARGLLEGKTYFVDLIDTKPIGIFVLYAAMLWVGKTIFMVRFFTAVWIGLTAFGIYRLMWRVGKNDRAAWAAALIYPLITSIFTFYGVVPNTELYFVLFTVWALVLIWGENASWRYALAGLLLGLGFLLKYVVFFDGLAFGALTLWVGWRQGQWQKAAWQRVLPMVAGAALPFAAIAYGYIQAGLGEVFYYYTFTVMGKYPVDKIWWKSGLYVLDFFGRFFPITLMALWAARRLQPTAKQLFNNFLLCWMLCGLLAVLYTGKLFGHYFIQLMPALSMLAAGFFYPECPRPGWVERLGTQFYRNLLVAIMVLMTVLQYATYYVKKDEVREVAAWLSARLEAGDRLYTGDYHQILYLLLDQQSPTPYVHRSLIWDEHHRYALGISIGEETTRILSARPKYILLQPHAPLNELKGRILQEYQLVHFFPFGVEVYLRKQSG
jgi:4-amino-4-deoxy-L-arabinose transferase-like glycosyltransferase